MKPNIQVQMKYLCDRILSILLFILLVPFFVIIALVIKFDDGQTVFFRQKRTGWHGQEFLIWKFRTMVPNADTFLDASGRIGNVNRITRVGKILRYLSLDELPQLINIMKGEMSFIGPRPVLCDRLERYSDEQKKRLLMKPGVTGLAQVNGRNTLKWSERIAYDVWYVEHYSLWLDLKILMNTVRVVFKREGIVLDRKPELYDDLGHKEL